MKSFFLLPSYLIDLKNMKLSVLLLNLILVFLNITYLLSSKYLASVYFKIKAKTNKSMSFLFFYKTSSIAAIYSASGRQRNYIRSPDQHWNTVHCQGWPGAHLHMDKRQAHLWPEQSEWSCCDQEQCGHIAYYKSVCGWSGLVSMQCDESVRHSTNDRHAS